MHGAEIAGFALVIDQCPLTSRQPCWFMAEFFVLRAYRRRGIAREALAQALAAHPGPWHVAVPLANAPALAVWSSLLARRHPEVSGLEFESDDWRLHSFRT